jgi:hypothetical protein
MIEAVLIALAPFDEIEVLFNEAAATTQKEGDLADFKALVHELGTADKGGNVIGDSLGGVLHDATDLGGGLALQSQPDDFGAVGQDGSDIMAHGAQRDNRVAVGLTKIGEIA